jgi:hypothetical protein
MGWRGGGSPGEGSAGRGGGGPRSCVSPQRWQSWARGWGRGAALSAAQQSPRMPPGALVRGNSLRARAARALGGVHCARARPSCAPRPHTPCLVRSRSPGWTPFPSLEVAPGPRLGKVGAVAGQTLGVFCADTRARGACSGRTEAGQSRLDSWSPMPLTVGVWLWWWGKPYCLGRSRKMTKQE